MDGSGRPITIDAIGLTYDAFGRQVEQNQSGTYYQVIYSPMGSKLGMFKGSTLQQLYVPLPGGAKAEYYSWGLSDYRHPDWLGTDRLESTTTRTILDNNAYAPFGEPYVQTGNGEISFTGQNKDTVWLQYDFLARQYDPKQGRWIAPDPAGLAVVNPANPQTWNRYAYVGNRPLSNVDPSGLDEWCDPDDDPFCECDSFFGCCDPVFGCGPGPGPIGGPPPPPRPPSPPSPPEPPDQRPRNGGVWPDNETLGLPGGLNIQPLSLGDLFGLNPNGPCDFGVCVPVGAGNNFLGGGIPGGVTFDPGLLSSIADLSTWFGRETQISQCEGSGRPPVFAHCTYFCESGDNQGVEQIGFGRIRAGCGPVINCPRNIQVDETVTYIFGFGFPSGQKVSTCVP